MLQIIAHTAVCVAQFSMLYFILYINNIEILLYISHCMENGLVYSSNLKVYIIALTS